MTDPDLGAVLAGLPAGPAPGDPLRFTTLAHAGRAILGPLDTADLDALVGALPIAPGARAVDVGCGKGELLVRLAARGATGLGIDVNPWHIRDADARARAAGVSDRVAWRVADARVTLLPDGVDLVACIGATGAAGGPVAAPGVLAARLRPGGCLVLGELFWRAEPDPDDAAAFGIGPGELLDRTGTLARMTAPGLGIDRVTVSMDGAWARYEAAYAAAIDHWAAAHPDDPERAAFLERAAVMRTTWARWRRDTMGFLVAILRRP